MNHGTTASLICPACGQAFLTMQHAMGGVAQCPHCAHSGPRANFGTQAQVAGVAQVRRRVAQPPQEWPVADQDPAPQPQPPVSASPPTVPVEAWQPQPQPQAPAHGMIRAPLQPSQALMPMHAPPPPAEFTTPPQLRPAAGRQGLLLLLAAAAVCGIGLWMWRDHAHTPAPGDKAAATTTGDEIRRAQIPLPAPPPEPKVELEDIQAYAADAKLLVTTLFAATTPEERAGCIHDAAKHSAEIEAMFGAATPQKIEVRQLAHLPAVLLSLPGGRHVPLFKLITSRCAAGALLRLETGADGKRRIFWPLLVETHEGRLPAYLKQQPQAGAAEADAEWFHVALRPSHGMDLPAALRPKYLTFDVQITAASEPHLVACVERDTPLGRFMDRETDWGRVCLARLLVRKLDIESDAPCMTVVDCEGAAER